MTNFRRTCPVCGSDAVKHANAAAFQLSIDRRCKTCGSVWRLPWGAVESVVGLLFGIGLTFGAGYLLLFPAWKLLVGQFGLEDFVVSLVFAALLLAGTSAVAKGLVSLRTPRGSVRILSRGEAPAPSEPTNDHA